MHYKSRISVFGGRDINEDIYKDTVEIGRQLAIDGYLVFCGGGKGIMEAIAKWVNEKNGTMSEIAYAFQLEKPVIGFKNWEIDKIVHEDAPKEVMLNLKEQLEYV